MGFTATKCLVALAAIPLSSISFTNCCSCAGNPTHLQELFCKASYVLEVVATGNVIIEQGDPNSYGYSERRYDIDTTRVYKSSPEYEALTSKNHIFTPRYGASCGVYLAQGVKYVILGSPSNGRISVYLCDPGLLKADDISPEHQGYLDNGFHQSCDNCRVESCTGSFAQAYPWMCEDIKTDCQTCIFDKEDAENECFMEFAHCKIVFDKCVWSDDGSGKLNTCLVGWPDERPGRVRGLAS